MIVCYLAGPLSGDVLHNTHVALVAARRLREAGYAVINPFAGVLCELVNGRWDYESWMREDLELLSRCDVVCRLPGPSPGADRECELADSLHKPVDTLENLIRRSKR